ncbi:PLP-dependent aminotransferase family protein [Corynebacterium aquatimens]|uniref:GntR family transcriptional regulator/MocR family aminotransferase n=1 Tax=Corynebacterium aquatimens TaxID=1190508 RepID=A0A931GXH5_9CORY|nr:PLP-dependent aminotransferase family protein [Corynebacterium aquatimens]MBG6121589.1 GntR family transcriptional regulator/MocR family aminotransferase [Corynebacterium aquatimens]WJY65871.1 HTH-type transcriptional regulatory protein GabR [Corynebacterium aquatimens]
MLIDLDRSRPVSLPAQIAAAIRDAITSGTLAPGDAVPSTRELAGQLGVSRGSVITAYDQLTSEGYLEASQGAPTRVHPSLPQQNTGSGTITATHEPPRTHALRRPGLPTISLKPSSGHAGSVRPAAWRKAWREAAADPVPDSDAAGHPDLRAAIAEHLRTARGIAVTAEDVLVTGGSREGLLLILLAYSRSRANSSANSSARSSFRPTATSLRVGVEDPGHPGLRRVIAAAGHEPVPCPIDDSGVVVPGLPEDLDALLVTPAFQYPLGASMPAARRAELLSWAAATGTTIIEDDFNAELRYRIAPQPPLAVALSPTTPAHPRVLTLGSFSTLLGRSLSVGYIVAPRGAAAELLPTRRIIGIPVSAVAQLAVAHLLRDGHVRRNTKAVRNRLAARRSTIQADVLPALHARGITVTEMAETGGVDLALSFPDAESRESFTAALADRGVECGRLESLWSGQTDGLIMSFAHVDDADFARAISHVHAAASHHY